MRNKHSSARGGAGARRHSRSGGGKGSRRGRQATVRSVAFGGGSARFVVASRDVYVSPVERCAPLAVVARTRVRDYALSARGRGDGVHVTERWCEDFLREIGVGLRENKET